MSSITRVTSVIRILSVSGTAMPLRGNDIDTDRIVPARYLKEITFARMGEYPFYDERFGADGKPKSHPFNDPRYKGASILLVNKNFGCGSSREHAPQALYRFGIHAIVGESFAAIFAGNCVMLGIPAVTVGSEEIEMLMKIAEIDPASGFTLDLETRTVSGGTEKLNFEMPESSRNALTNGTWDSTSLLLENLGKVKAAAARLPYIGGFSS
jgi:3-isopropylmalate/(R)-2-methylmalate dehydratase small subunit